jgi:membrane protein required for colicin V production
MNVFDVIVIGCVLFFCVKGYYHGFVNEIFSLVILAAGLVLSILFCRPAAGILAEFVENRDLALILAFVGIFIVVTLVLLVIRNTLLNIIERVNMTDADSIIGALIGLFKGVLLCGLVSIFLKNHKVLHLEEPIRGSLIYPVLERAVTPLLLMLPDRVFDVARRVLGT